MAIENNDIQYDVDIDLQDSLREIDRLQQKLKSFGSDLATNATEVQQKMRAAANDYVKYIQRLERELRQLQKRGADTSAHEARLTQIRNRQGAAPAQFASNYSGAHDQGYNPRVGQQADLGRAQRAVFQRELNEMRSTTKELMGRYFDELNSSHLREIKRSLTDLRTDETLLRQRMQDRGDRARMGDAAFGFQKQGERRNLNGGASQFLSQAGIMGNYMAVGGAMGGAYMLANSVVQLDKEFRQFQAITDTTNTAMGALEDRMLSVAEKTKFTALEITEAATLMGQAGMSAAEVSEAIEPISMLATAAGTELKPAVDVVTSALNIFNLQASEAGHLSNVFTAALNESKLTLDQLALSLQYAGNISATAGVSYNELTAAVGALANAGIRSGSTIGTGLRQLLVDLMSPSKKLRGELELVGLTMADIDIQTNGLAGVMMNLRDAGFDTGNAFEGLEVRAAAAYTALANNLDVMAELRQSLILTNAAAKANEKQMESFANTALNFGSGISALVYTAFKPFLGVLQDGVQEGTSFLSMLRQMGPIVEVVGTVFASLVSAYLITRVGRLAIGLLSIATGAKAAAGGVSLLTLALRANPIFLGLTALTAGITLLRQFGDTAGDVAMALDALEAQQAEYQGQVDNTTNRISALNAAMEDLIKKQKGLDADGNSSLRQMKIMEVVASFTELAGAIDVSKASVGDLLNAMKDLNAELVDQLPGAFELLLAKVDQRIALIRQTIGNQGESPENYSAVAAASRRFGNGGSVYGDQVAAFNPQVAETFGDKIGRAFLATTGQLGEGELNGQQAEALQTGLQTAIAKLQNQISPLQDKGNRTDYETAMLGNLNEDLKFLQELSNAFEPLKRQLIDLQAADAERNITRSKSASASLLGMPAYKSAQEMEKEAEGYLSRNLSEITDTKQSIEDAEKAYGALNTTLQAQVQEIEAQLKVAADEMRATGEFTENEINSAVKGSELHQEVAKLEVALKKGSKEAHEAFVDFQAYMLERTVKNLKAQITNTGAEINKAKDGRQLDLLEDQLYALDNQLSAAEIKLFNLKPDDDIGEHSHELDLARRKMADDQADRRDELLSGVIEQRAKLAEKANEIYTEDLQTQLDNINREMGNLVETVDKNSTAEYLKKVRDKLEELNTKAKALAGEIASISVSGDYGAFGLGGLPSSSASEIHKLIIAAANAKGIPPEIALAISSFETGGSFSPTAKNPSSSAYGLYQNTDKNWASHNLPASGRNSISMQIEAGMLDMLRTQKSLGSTQLSFQDYYGSHLLGQAGYKKAMANPNANAVSTLGTDQVMLNGGNLSQTTSEFLDMITRKAAVHLDKVKGLVEKPMDAAGSALENKTKELTSSSSESVTKFGDKEKAANVKRTTKILDAAAKQLEAEINTLMVQSGKANDPKALQSIMDQVRSKWAEMMEKEVASFTAENQGQDGFDERLASMTADLEAGLTGKLVALLDRYQASIENMEYAPLLDAEANLAAAQNPLNAKNFTPTDIAALERNVQLQERAATIERLNQLEQLHTYILQQVSAAEAQYGANSQQVQALKQRQYDVETSLGAARRQNTADTQAAAKGEITLAQSIEAANKAWMQRNGLMDNNGEMISAAERAGQAWGQVLDGLTSGFSQLFMDLAEGTLSAEEAFKKFGLSVIQMLMQIIAKQLALNLVQSLMGGASGGGFFSMLFGGGAATGTYIAGVKRAANGEYVSGSNPFRDSELRSVMPGEMILRTSAVNQIGRDALEKVNALGNRKISSGMPTLPQAQANDNRPINIWAVLPEEKSQIGPEDVVAYISDDLRNRGTTRQLIKAINAGRM